MWHRYVFLYHDNILSLRLKNSSALEEKFKSQPQEICGTVYQMAQLQDPQETTRRTCYINCNLYVSHNRSNNESLLNLKTYLDIIMKKKIQRQWMNLQFS